VNKKSTGPAVFLVKNKLREELFLYIKKKKAVESLSAD